MRLTDYLLVQQIDDALIVIVNQATGEEVTFPLIDAPKVRDALAFFDRTGPFTTS